MISQIISPTPLGDLFALASENHLLMLEFADSKWLEKKLQNLNSDAPSFWTEWRIQEHGSFASTQDDGNSKVLTQTRLELSEYFEGTRKKFSIPVMPHGTEFQMKAWQALEQIPYGETRNYLEEATMIGNPKAVRAIGGANHNNPIVIIIPCHRVIGKSGKLVGYGGWLNRKTWLLEHEKKYL